MEGSSTSSSGSSAKLTISLRPTEIKDLLASARAGLEAGQKPVKTETGTGGSYFMRGRLGNYVLVFKPLDEEPNAENDPLKKSVSIIEVSLQQVVFAEGLRKGTSAGLGGFREVFAYLLDHPKSGHRSGNSGEEKGFAGVPPTTGVSCLHSVFNRRKGSPVIHKRGSLQKFMENEGNCAMKEVSKDERDKVIANFDQDEVHKIAVLDIRLANADRHEGNILRSKSVPVKLIPIDHGYCFPHSFKDMRFAWLAWPQAKRKFSTETIKYIRDVIDAEEDIRLLKSHGWSNMPPSIARVFRISTMLLKKGAERNLTPYNIGTIMCRGKDQKSDIEKIVEKASSEKDDAKFIEAVSREIDSYLEKRRKLLQLIRL